MPSKKQNYIRRTIYYPNADWDEIILTMILILDGNSEYFAHA